jgi:hypothetical protein
MDVCVVSVVCCQVEVSATGWSLVQRSPTDCGVSQMCVIMKPRLNEEAQAHISLSSHRRRRSYLIFMPVFTKFLESKTPFKLKVVVLLVPNYLDLWESTVHLYKNGRIYTSFPCLSLIISSKISSKCYVQISCSVLSTNIISIVKVIQFIPVRN